MAKDGPKLVPQDQPKQVESLEPLMPLEDDDTEEPMEDTNAGKFNKVIKVAEAPKPSDKDKKKAEDAPVESEKKKELAQLSKFT